MKILISAIACNPKGGSEAGIGWRILSAIAMDHQCYVIVGARNKPGWDAARTDGLIPDQVQVKFVGTNVDWHRNRLLARIQSWQEYRKFSKLQLEVAKEWCDSEQIDLAHQITYATWRIPSELWRLSIPFIWGPIGGAADFPSAFLKILSPVAIVFEIVRKFATFAGVMSPRFRRCLARSTIVIAANGETESFLCRFKPSKLARLWSGYLSERQLADLKPQSQHTDVSEDHERLRIFAGGNLEGRKGIAIALRALAEAKKDGVRFRYIVAGGGPELRKLKRLTEDLGLNDEDVVFHPGYHGADYVHVLRESEIYLMPSFRETTPVTLLEAMVAGCYPIVMDASAAGQIVREVGGTAVPPTGHKETVQDIKNTILDVWRDRDAHRRKALDISMRTSEMFGIDRFRDRLSGIYLDAMRSKPLMP